MRPLSFPLVLSSLLLVALLLGASHPAEIGITRGAPAPRLPDAGPDATARAPEADVAPASGSTFDALYSRDFRLHPLDARPIPPMQPPVHAAKLTDGNVDPVHGTRVYRATSAQDGDGARMRHDYSRRQAFNADNSRFIAMDAEGYWHLYDGLTLRHLRQLDGLAGDCEPLWDPRNPDVLYHTSNSGGLVWWAYDVRRDARSVLFDFSGKTPWPEADAFWTKGEGALSADGRTLALMATHYDSARKQKSIYGLLTLDVATRKIVATLDASRFGGRYPDHVATSASGRYVIAAWGKEDGGTRAYTRDFSGVRQLHTTVEHSDVALGPNGEDLFVFADYDAGAIVARDIDTLAQFELAPLYQGNKESYAVHISGQAFDRPGWVVLSTYGDSADYGRTRPAPTLRPQYRKVWLAELRPNGRQFGLAHIRASSRPADSDKDYFLEPQATVSRDLSRILFASDYGTGTIEDTLIGLPSWAVPPAAPAKAANDKSAR